MENTPDKDEELAKLRRTMRRNFIIAGILGVIMMVMGFYAAQNIKSWRNSSAVVEVVTCSEDCLLF